MQRVALDQSHSLPRLFPVLGTGCAGCSVGGLQRCLGSGGWSCTSIVCRVLWALGGLAVGGGSPLSHPVIGWGEVSWPEGTEWRLPSLASHSETLGSDPLLASGPCL